MLVNVFRQTSQQQVADDLNCDSHEHRDEDESNRLFPNLRPQVKTWSKPLRDGGGIAQSREQTQHPSRTVEHTMNKRASISVEHAQKDHDHEQNIYRIDCHF